MLSYDFYLPDFRIAIEYNGIQHYKPVDYFGGDERFLKQKICDDKKQQISNEQNIKLIIINCNNDEENMKCLETLLDKLITEKKVLN